MHQLPVCQSLTQNLSISLFFLGISSSSLTLQPIKRIDDGEYTCLASNSIGHGQSSVHIRVQCKPKKKFLLRRKFLFFL
jgi:hypothetical protein